MSSTRQQILQWFRRGRISQAALSTALRVAGAEPAPKDWCRFIDALMLWCGAVFMAAGVIFFFAYNWQEMGRFTKLGLLELALTGTVVACWQLGLERRSGQAALLAATLLVGALLALVGQTYQTGADPWQLFATWAVMVLPWVAIGRSATLLLFWVGLVNLALLLYFQTFPRIFGAIGLLFSTENLLWPLFLFNTAVLCLWELAAWRRIAWLSERWPLRVLSVASSGLITVLAVWTIFDFGASSAYALLVMPVWLAAVYVTYRHKLLDLFVLSGAVLSLIIVVTAWLSKLLLDRADSAAALLFIGMVVVGLSAAGGFWLKSIAGEEHR